MKAPLVSVVIVGYNAKHFLPECLGSLIKGAYKNIEILYVDNGSTDGTSEYINKYYPQIILIKNSKNVGFSPAHEGILAKVKGDAVLLLNTDTIVEGNLLKELIKVLYERKDTGAVQPKVLMYPDKNKIDSIGAFFLNNGLLYHFGYEKDHNRSIYNKPMEIFSTKGAVMLIKKEVLDKVSFPKYGNHRASIFDQDYFTAFEDTDLAMRIWLAGYRILYVPSAKTYHIGGGTVMKMIRSFIIFHGEKNRIATYIKNLSPKYLFKVLPRFLIMLQLEFFAYLFIRRRLDVALAVQRAILWNIFHLNEILKKRHYVQTRIRVVDDESFIPYLTKKVRLSYYYYLVIGLGGYKD